MNIAYIVPKLVNKGPILVVKELVNVMTRHNHNCKVYYFDKENDMTMPCSTERISMYKSLNFNSYDVVHSHGLRPDLYVYMHKPRQCGAMVITTLHNYVFHDLKFQYNGFISCIFGHIWIKLLSRHDKIVALSKDAMTYYKRWINEKKLCYVYNTRDIQISEKSIIPEEDEHLIRLFKGDKLIIGVNAVLTERKGVDQLIMALPGLLNFKLVVVGDGKSMADLQRMAKDRCVQDRVLFMGYRKDAYRYLPYYDIYALPSRSEGFVLTLLEAAIYNKKVVCSDIPIFKETLSNDTAVFFRINDISSLVDAIMKANNVKDIGTNLNFKYKKEYSPECFYKRYLSIYKD